MKLLFFFMACAALPAQTVPAQVARILESPLQTPDVAAYQLREYLARKEVVPAVPPSAAQWTAEAHRLRWHILDGVIFHGWPAAWVQAPLRAEDLGSIPSGPGYRMRKIRYEIVPGFYSTAILYEPGHLTGKHPAVLHVNGHVGAEGKAVEYKQKRCITLARNGIVALNLEWLAYGELGAKENLHWFGAHLDLAGANGIGLFYLAMRKGLDFLDQLPEVDRTRLGVTGLSGGGWQTIVLSAFDERVAVAVPVAGYAALRSRVERRSDPGDLEQNATDLIAGQDYSHFTALRAPRPTLLVYNAEDDCCFRAPLVKPYLFDAIVPFFKLYGKADRLAWHENTDPGTHNYQLDNRLSAYRFIARAFGLPEIKEEPAAGAEIKSAGELAVGLPPGNLTILGLARQLAAGARRGTPDRARLAQVIRYREVQARPWMLGNSKNKGLESQSARVDFSNGLSATAVWFKAIGTEPVRQATIVLHDKGKKECAALVSDRVNRGDAVIAADLLLTGDAVPQHGTAMFSQMLASTGDRPLGIEVAQLLALAQFARTSTGAAVLRLEVTGFRNQAIALIAAALQPGLFREVVVHDGHRSLQELLDQPVEYASAPELFCLDLYKEFDLDGIAALAAPTVVR